MAKSKKVKLTDLRSATAASLKAALGKKIAGKVPIICGIFVEQQEIERLDQSGDALAKEIAQQVSIASGIKVKPGAQKIPGGIIVGFVQPKILK